MIVQELLTRLGFSVDMTGANTFNNKLKALAMGAMAIGATIGAKLMAGFVMKTAEKFGQFEDQLNQTRAVTGATVKDMKLLENQALKLATSTKFSATEIAGAQGELAKAGFDKVNDVLAATPGILNLAAAGGMGVAQSAELAAGSINGFGLRAKDAGMVADVFAKTANLSAVGLSDIAETAKYAAPSFRIAGQNINDFATLTAIMGNNMIKGSMAGTALSTGLTRLATQPKAALKALEKWGIKTHDQKGNMINIIDLLIQMKHKLKDATQQEKVSALTKIFGMEASRGFLAILNTEEKEIRRVQSAMEKNKNVSKNMADIMNSGLIPSFNKLKSATEVLYIKIGQQLAPALMALMNGARSVITWFTNLSPTTHKLIGYLAILTGVLLTGLSAFLAFKLIQPILTAVWLAILKINLTAMAIPLAILAVIGILAFAITELYVFYNGGNSLINKYLKSFPKVQEALKSFISNMVELFNLIKIEFYRVVDVFIKNWSVVLNAFHLIFPFIIAVVSAFIYFASIVLMVASLAVICIMWIITVVGWLVKAIYDFLFNMPSFWASVWDSVYAFTISFVNKAIAAIKFLLTTIGVILLALPAIFASIFVSSLVSVMTFIGQAGSAFSKLVSDIISWFGNAFLNVIPNFISGIGTSIGNIASQLGNLVTGGINVPVSVGAGGSGKGLGVGVLNNNTTVNVGGSSASASTIAGASSRGAGSGVNKALANVAKNYRGAVR